MILYKYGLYLIYVRDKKSRIAIASKSDANLVMLNFELFIEQRRVWV